ncbi:alkaline phosphatase family protein [Streptomyces sp. SP17KL33]|uniref:alkaline phosphatase family protein n=1 Tax=Streptomyces sp. SP17KL33 TaxID=3002534 RepID=UPI002E7A4A6D|nr:alkaline phosphatase family protein [Streptomyces sp. SP17KL33]MEE1831936.1 alkaline phosphatase family protein [Streptomyces sp. SP17KL33]
MVDTEGDGRPGRGRVLVVGMDGVRFDRLARSAATAPVLHALMAAGAHGRGLLPYGEVDGQAEGGPSTSMAYTDSGPGWSSVLTGVWPDRHGVTGNDFAGADYSRHPDFLSRAVAARPGLRTVAAVSWPELVDRGALGSTIGERVRYDGESDGYETADRLVADTAVRRIAEDDPDALFVYFGATDEAGHATGPLSPAYDRALLAQDAHLGRLLDAIAARRSDPGRANEHWTVLVTTDHGHLDTGGHGGDTHAEREVFVILAELGTAVGPGTAVEPGTAPAEDAGSATGEPGAGGPGGASATAGAGGESATTGTGGEPGTTSTGTKPTTTGAGGESATTGAGGEVRAIGAVATTGTAGAIWSPRASPTVRAPRALGGTPLDSPRLIDIAPTVLDRLGIPLDPAWELPGRVLPRTVPSPPPLPTSERS